MANLKDLIVNGSARVLGTLYANIKGDVDGNAKTATSATNDSAGNKIVDTYLSYGETFEKMKASDITKRSDGYIYYADVKTQNSQRGIRSILILEDTSVYDTPFSNTHKGALIYHYEYEFYSTVFSEQWAFSQGEIYYRFRNNPVGTWGNWTIFNIKTVLADTNSTKPVCYKITTSGTQQSQQYTVIDLTSSSNQTPLFLYSSANFHKYKLIIPDEGPTYPITIDFFSNNSPQGAGIICETASGTSAGSITPTSSEKCIRGFIPKDTANLYGSNY